MGVAAIGGYENVNGRAMDLWEAIYPNVLLVALTDTFSTEVFYQVCQLHESQHGLLAEAQRARAGLRQGPRESEKVDWVEARFGGPFCVCPTSTRNLPINENRSHHEDDCLLRRIERGKGIGTQETVR